MSGETKRQRLRLVCPVEIEVDQPGRRCEHCNGVHFVTLRVDVSGSEFGDSYRHTAECKTQFCRHGERYANETECAKCLADDHCPHGVGWESEDGCESGVTKAATNAASLRTLAADLAGALEKCAETFAGYAAIHRAKGPGHEYKAADNDGMAIMCRVALALYREGEKRR